MNEEHFDLIGTELEHADEPTEMSPEALLLERLRITPEKELKPMDFLFRLFGKPCFPRGELVAITGKAKSGKTYLSSILTACCSLRDVLHFHREQENLLRVLWYDTEQSDLSTQDILCNRLKPMTEGNTEQMDVFNVRTLPWKQRRHLLAVAISQYQPDLVIIDGIRDLVDDINDGVLAQEVMEELMQLAGKGSCCITCILHQNKSGEDSNLRGWIGTELMNKAFEVYACEKLMPQRIFAVKQTLTRKFDIEQTLYFEVDDKGLPTAVTTPMEEFPDKKADKLPKINSEYIVHDENGGWQFDIRRLFLAALRGEEELNGSTLRERVMQLSGIVIPFKYNQLLHQALEQKIIDKTERDGITIYRPAPF